MRLRCVIIDDEPLAINLLKDYCQWVKDLEVKETFTHALEGLYYLQENPIDLLFLDIQMPELTGLQVMKVLQKPPKVILTTAYAEHALESYELDVVDYLLKPIALDRFNQALEKAKRQIITEPRIIDEAPAAYLFVKSEYRNVRVDLDTLLYLKSLGDYVQLHTTSGKIMTLENLGSLEKRLQSRHFCRIHKSYLVNMQHIRFVERKRAVVGEDYLPIGNTYYEDFVARLQ